MKKGFTLVELLIVVVILVTLMTMVFRLGAIGGDSERRAVTVQRVQLLENALSGYYAAFGMYPPVKLHGSRNIFLKTDDNGAQSDSGEENTALWGWANQNGDVTDSNAESVAWRQISAALRSQPMGCEFPFDEDHIDDINEASAELRRWASESSKMPDHVRQKAQAGFRQVRPEDVAAFRNETDWNKIKLFRFGVMSYLLPRYLVMMNGDIRFFNQYAQWSENNTKPSNAMTGDTMEWDDIQTYINSSLPTDLIKVANIPSQAVCARWLPTLKGALACNSPRTLFGVQIRGDQAVGQSLPFWDEDSGMMGGCELYSPDGYGGSSDGPFYALDSITMLDGWGRELYYYSPSPHQSYTVWSAGPNGKTFPPWVSRDSLPQDANQCISVWIKDDIVGQSN